jgi:hypothetical protein
VSTVVRKLLKLAAEIYSSYTARILNHICLT